MALSRGKLTPLFHLLLFLVVSSFLFITPNQVKSDPLPEVTILIYHRFGETKYPTTNVSVERFRE